MILLYLCKIFIPRSEGPPLKGGFIHLQKVSTKVSLRGAQTLGETFRYAYILSMSKTQYVKDTAYILSMSKTQYVKDTVYQRDRFN